MYLRKRVVSSENSSRSLMKKKADVFLHRSFFWEKNIKKKAAYIKQTARKKFFLLFKGLQ